MLIFTAAILWTAAIVCGGKRVLTYASIPGSAGLAPEEWPADTTLSWPRDRMLLLVFIHPQCPCSRSSVANLARISAQCGNRLQIQVLSVAPADAPEGWKLSESIREASTIPTTRVISDVAGREAGRFGALTSGSALLYDLDGRLAFAGGLTPARGHEGDCVGSDAVISLVRSGCAEHARSPVFGCPLFSNADEAEAFKINAADHARECGKYTH